MSTQELITQEQSSTPAFVRSNQLSAGANVGAIAIEQERAIAEAQGQLVLAKKFPRDELTSHSELMRSCKSKAFAEVAFYTVPNRGHGPSIRFAEEVARVYGNFQYGHRELSRDSNKSEIEVFAWDMEKNNRSIRQLTVLHISDTKQGPKILRDQADIDNKIANVASKQVRGRILALMPKWLVQEAIEECRLTLAGNNTEPLEARLLKMTKAFNNQFGVTKSMLERHLGHPLSETIVEELVDLIGVFNALKEGVSPREYFSAEQDAESNEKTASALAETAKAGATADKPAAAQQAKATKPPAKAKPEPKPAAAETAQTAATETAAEQDSNTAEENSKTVEEAAATVTEAEQQAPIEAPEQPSENNDDVF